MGDLAMGHRWSSVYSVSGHTVREMRPRAVFLLVLLLAACTGNGTVTTEGSTLPTLTSAPPGPTSTLPPVVECPGVGDFEEGSGIADVPSEGSDSRKIGRISWETNDQCETVHIDFETSEGAPATTVPEIQVNHLESFQVLRVSLDVEATVVTDQLVETSLVDRLFVVRSLSGGMFLDLHLAAPAAVRVSTSSSPARLSLELRPGIVPFVGESAVGENVVLTSPVAGSVVDVTTQLFGYSRTFEANVLVIATQAGEVVAETDTLAADYLETWGEYRVLVDLPPGEVSVFVGEESPEDGNLKGITVDLTVS